MGYAFPYKACMWLCLIQKSPAFDEDILLRNHITPFLRGDSAFCLMLEESDFQQVLYI